MRDIDKTKEQLLEKLVELRQRITELFRVKEDLEQSEKRYRTLFEDSRDGIAIANRKGRVIYVNEAASDLLGYTVEEIKQINFPQLCRNPQDVYAFQQKLERDGGVRDYELRLFKKDKSEIDCLISVSVQRDNNGKISEYQSIIRDITEQKLERRELRETLYKLRETLGATIRAIAMTVEIRDPYTAGHQQRVADLARAIASEMGLSETEIDGVRTAGIIHDLGKTSVPAEILSKPGEINEHEIGIIKTHPRVGYEILKDIEFPWPVAQIVLQHHERMNGSGYPQGLSGEDILLEARIIAVADVIEAMASHRPYRAALGVDKALEEILENKGTLYDSEVAVAARKLFIEKNFQFKIMMGGPALVTRGSLSTRGRP